MPARLRNFIIERGGDFYRRLLVTDSAGVAVDLTSGYVARFVVEPTLEDGVTALLDLNSTDHATQVVLGNGYIDLAIPKATLAALDLSGITRSGTLTEPAANDEPDFYGSGKLAYHRVLLNGPTTVDDDVKLRGQICFESR